MRLRTRLQTELALRLAALLPEAMQTVWDHQAVVVAIEQLTFKSAGGFEDEVWERQASISGIMRCELRADGIDGLEVEPLLANLIGQTVFLPREDAVEIGKQSEAARAIFLDLRDVVRDQTVATALRFKIDGTLFKRVAPVARPAALSANGETP